MYKSRSPSEFHKASLTCKYFKYNSRPCKEYYSEDPHGIRGKRKPGIEREKGEGQNYTKL